MIVSVTPGISIRKCHKCRDELVGANRYWNDWNPVAGQQFGYNYDSIGNRKSASYGGDTNGANMRTNSYTANSLNQYSSIANAGYQEICGAAVATNSVTVNSGTADRKGEYFHREITVVNGGGSLWQGVTNAVTGRMKTSHLWAVQNQPL